MKARNTTIRLIAIVIALGALATSWTLWGASPATAIVFENGRTNSFGVALGQTARLNVVNTAGTNTNGNDHGQDRGIVVDWRFLDADGNVVAQSEGRVRIEPGHTMSFDLNGDTLESARDALGRIQLRAEVRAIGEPNQKNLDMNVEIFDNATGKTTFAVSP